jgi:hypothetical protein
LSALNKIDTECLRAFLGTFWCFVRFLEREINKRCFEQVWGGGVIEKIEGKKKISKR